jgi:putative tryptophan/tyrosine transport system substrate-binding protein
MRRRELISLISGVAAWPVAARAQPATRVVGFLRATSHADSAHLLAALRQGLNETGYVEADRAAFGLSQNLVSFEKWTFASA